MASIGRQFRLGRNAQLMVDGVVLQSVQDAYVRIQVDEVEAHHGGDKATAFVTTRRSISVQFVVIDPRESRFIGERLELSFSQSPRPQLVLATVTRGHITRSFYATVHDIDEDQPLRGISPVRFLLKQWGKLPLQAVGAA